MIKHKNVGENSSAKDSNPAHEDKVSWRNCKEDICKHEYGFKMYELQMSAHFTVFWTVKLSCVEITVFFGIV